MTLRKIVIAGAATLFSLSANSVSAQNKTMNIGPGQPCMPGYSCIIQPPPPPNPGIGVQPACFPPNILVRIQTNFGIRYECRFAQVQPIQPVLPVQPIQPAPGQYSQAHYLYCIARFKSYRQATNTYTAFSGQTKFCNSPFN